MSSSTQQGDGMGHTQFISISWEGGIQFLIEAVAHTDSRNIDCQRDVMQGEVDLYIGLFSFNIVKDALQIR